MNAYLATVICRRALRKCSAKLSLNYKSCEFACTVDGALRGQSRNLDLSLTRICSASFGRIKFNAQIILMDDGDVVLHYNDFCRTCESEGPRWTTVLSRFGTLIGALFDARKLPTSTESLACFASPLLVVDNVCREHNCSWL